MRRRILPSLAVVVGAPALAGCPRDPPAAAAFDLRVAYCATAQACALVAPRAFSACVSSVDGPPASVQSCIGAARSDCAAARACTYDGTHPSLCGFGAHPLCDGNVALTCDGMTTTTSQTDCSLVGEVCVVGPTAARCALGTCDRPGAVSYCDGPIAVASCARPFLSAGRNCGALDADCLIEPDLSGRDGGVATCRGHGGGCVVGSCDRGTLVACLDGHQARLGCAAGERCFPASRANDHAACALADECNPDTFFDRCDPRTGVLSYCRRGRQESLDCRALGFVDCRGSPASGCVTALVDDGGGPPLTDAPLP